jgi:hypothetical protein
MQRRNQHRERISQQFIAIDPFVSSIRSSPSL